MTKTIRNAVTIFATLCAVAIAASMGQADESASIAPTEFESVPVVFRHDSAAVLSIEISPQGEHIFAALSDGSMMMLDRTTRKPVRIVKCHDGIVSDLVVSHSGDLLVTAGYDGTVKTWRLPNFEPAGAASCDSGRINAVAISPDGRTMASCGYDKTVRIWNVSEVFERGSLTGHAATFRALAFSPGGNILATAGDDGIVRMWSVEDLNEIGTRSGHAGRVRDVAFSPDGKTLAAAGEDGTVLVWSVTDPAAAPGTFKHGAMIWCVAFSPRGSLLAAGDSDGTIHIWDLATERMTSTLEGHTDTVTSLRFTEDSETLFSSSHDGSINSWRAKQPPHPALATIDIDAGKVWAMAISPDGSRIVVGGQRGFFRVLDLATGKQIAELQGSHPATVDCLEYSRDGQFIATGSWRNNEVIVWRAHDGAMQTSFKAEGHVRAIAFSPDGKKITAGCDDKLLFVWNTESGELISKMNAHALSVYDVSFSPDGKTIVTCSGNWTEAKPGDIKLWSADSLEEIARLEGHEVAIRSVVFSPDGSRLASVSEDGVLKVWDVATKSQQAVMRNSSGARTLDWSPDGQLLAAGLHDGTTNVWNAESGMVIRQFGGSDDTFSVRFVADGSVLCGVGGEAKVILWDTSDLTGTGSAGRVSESVRNWAKGAP